MTCPTGDINIWLLRLFAGSWAVMSILASLLLRSFAPGFVLWWLPLLATLFFVFGLVVPVAMQRPYCFIDRLFAPVGRGFAFLMLAVVFILFFTSFAVVLRLLRWDPLRLRRSHWPASGWVARNKGVDDSDYRWQY